MQFFRIKQADSPFLKAIRILNSTDRSKLLIVVLIQILLGLFDLVGVLLIGVLGAITVQGIESRGPGNRVNSILSIMHLQHLTFQAQVATLGLVAALVLILKTLTSALFTRRIFFFLSYKGSQISSELVAKVLSQNLLELQRLSSQELLYCVSYGVNAIFIGILATTINIIVDLTLFLFILGGLLAADPTLAAATFILFFLTAFFLHRMLQVRAKTIGVRISELSIKSNEKILEVLKSYRETVVRNRGSYYAEEIRKLRYSLASVTAEQNFQPYISKYVIELMTVLGGLSLTAYEFGTKNSVYAVSILTLFIAASSRITPAALRIQQGFLAVRNNVGVSESTFKIIKDLENANLESLITVEPNFVYDDFLPRIELSGLKFKYNTAGRFALDITNLKIEPGTRVAVVGPSGAGKTTFVDILLGVLRPQEGHVLISGETPVEASRKWSGAISYVPQEIFISSGSIRENISLGFGPKTATDERVWAALDVALLAEFAKSYPDEIDSLIGEEGANISGGQRQRLGIARALFTSPKLLVLDESTSSLDGQTEAGINRAISNLSRDVTVVIVAHRLSTVMNADQVIYMNQGKILAIGKFEEVRKAVVDFDQQATLMGL